MAKWTIPDTPSPEAIVKAALALAAEYVSQNSLSWRYSIPWGGKDFAKEIRALSSDPAEVAAILEKAGEQK
jgi:hypothetical protein